MFDERASSRWRIQAFSSSGENIEGSPRGEVSSELSLDAILSMTEILFIIPPALYSVRCIIGFLIPGVVKPLQAGLDSRIFVWQFLLLVGAVAVGSVIRRRQWGRICRESESGMGVNLLARIEKVEEDLRSSATIVRVLSRQLEKLGIRFRVTRKALKEPITETAALAQKNSEATRALALQEDILEKELGEIQKVLLAMQEQQQKQLELILAIGKAGRLFENKRDTSLPSDQHKPGSSTTVTNPFPGKKDSKRLEIQTGTPGTTNNDRP